MYKVKSGEWSAQTQMTFAFDKEVRMHLQVSCTSAVSVLFDGVPVYNGAQFDQHFCFDAGEVQVVSDAMFGMRYTVSDARSGEEVDPEVLTAASFEGNALRQIRRRIEREASAFRREHFGPGYEVDDNEPMFEEDYRPPKPARQSPKEAAKDEPTERPEKAPEKAVSKPKGGDTPAD